MKTIGEIIESSECAHSFVFSDDDRDRFWTVAQYDGTLFARKMTLDRCGNQVTEEEFFDAQCDEAEFLYRLIVTDFALFYMKSLCDTRVVDLLHEDEGDDDGLSALLALLAKTIEGFIMDVSACHKILVDALQVGFDCEDEVVLGENGYDDFISDEACWLRITECGDYYWCRDGIELVKKNEEDNSIGCFYRCFTEVEIWEGFALCVYDPLRYVVGETELCDLIRSCISDDSIMIEGSKDADGGYELIELIGLDLQDLW